MLLSIGLVFEGGSYTGDLYSGFYNMIIFHLIQWTAVIQPGNRGQFDQ